MSEPRIVLFDIETIPNMKEAMKVWPQLSNYPGLTLKAQISTVICFGYKVFASNEEVKCVNAWDFPEWENDINSDEKIIKEAFNILSQADAVVTHNGKRFDWKFIQTRLLKHQLTPLHKIPHIDTCQTAKSNLLSFNNRLGNLDEFFGGAGKMENGGWDLWVNVSNRCKESQNIMSEYCKKDVEALERLFRQLRPLISNIPNYNLFNNSRKEVCPYCGSTRLKKDGQRYCKTSIRQRVRCKDCGGKSTLNASAREPRSL